MSRTKRTISYRYIQQREDILNNEVIYPFDTNYWYSLTNRKKYPHNGKFTDWDDFFSCRWYHGYDGSLQSSISDPSSKSPSGRRGWCLYSNRFKRKVIKKLSSRAARLYAKNEIRNLLNEM